MSGPTWIRDGINRATELSYICSAEEIIRKNSPSHTDMITVDKEVKGNAMLDPGQITSIIDEDLQRKQIKTTNLNIEDTYQDNLGLKTMSTDADRNGALNRHLGKGN